MSTTSDSRNPVEALAEEFLERKRRGEKATPEEYAEKHPALADEILALFPALLMMEDLGGDSVERTGSVLTSGGAIGGAAASRLGEFRLLREVGRGGMGVVYEAEQESLGRRVALKVLPSGAITDTKQLRRFEREARSAARLHHTNIVPVFGVGQHEGTHFYVMQFIQGQGLDAVLDELRGLRDARTGKPEPAARTGRSHRQRSAADIALSLATGRFMAGAGDGDVGPGTATLPWSASELAPGTSSVSDSDLSSSSGSSGITTFTESDRKFAQSVARIGVQVAEALAYAHGQGVLHRDIKPSNLLLDRDGNVWVADFGLAKATGGEDLTHTGDIVGTVRYMAPERFQGTGDARSDIYALGLTLYELLALKPAFDEQDRARLIHQVTQEDPMRLRKLNRHVPPDLETIIHKAIAREPAQRYATAETMVGDLNRFLEGRPILARRVSPAEQAWRWCNRNPWLAGALGTAASALVAAAIISTIYGIEQGQAKERISGLAGNLDRDRENLRTERAKLREALAESNRRRAMLHYERGQADCEQGEIGTGMLYFVESWKAALAAGDGDAQRLARMSLAAWRPQLPRLRRLTTPAIHAGELVCGADGKIVTWYSDQHTEHILDPLTGQPVGSPLVHENLVGQSLFDPQGKTVVTRTEDGTIRLWDASSGKPLGPSLRVEGALSTQTVGIDRRLIAAGSDPSTAQIYDLTTGRPVGPVFPHGAPVIAAIFGADETTVLTSGQDRRVRSWDAASGKSIGATIETDSPGFLMQLSPDGKALLLISGDGKARLRDTTSGKPIGEPLTHGRGVSFLAFSPDGQTVATAGYWDFTARLWDVATAKLLGLPLPHRDDVSSIAFSRDGKSILTTSADMTARVYDFDPGQAVGMPLQYESRRGFRALIDGKNVIKSISGAPTLLTARGSWPRSSTGRPWSGTWPPASLPAIPFLFKPRPLVPMS